MPAAAHRRRHDVLATGRPRGRCPTVPLSRPSVITQRAPASRSPATSSAHCCGGETSSRVLAADLGEHDERSAARRDQVALLGQRHRRDAAGDLDAGEPDLGGPVQALLTCPGPRRSRAACRPGTAASRRPEQGELAARPGRGRRCPSRTSRRRCTAPRTRQRADRARRHGHALVEHMGEAYGPAACALRSGRLRKVGATTLPILHVSSTFRQDLRRSDCTDREEQPWSRREHRLTLDELAGLPAIASRRCAPRARSGWSARSSAAASWVHGPGDDGAVVAMRASADAGAGGQVIACGEAMLPAFVAADPYGAGVAAVLANVNDLAAMGATPLAIVDTVVGSRRAGPRGAARHEGRLRAGTTSRSSAGT